MRCGCPECGTYTVQVEKGIASYCQCPQCGWKCSACMGGKRAASIQAMTREGAQRQKEFARHSEEEQ